MMSKKILMELMGSYLNYDQNQKHALPNFMPVSKPNCPIVPKEDTWERVSDPNRLMKKFNFNSFDEMAEFLDEVLKYQEDVKHHGRISIDYRDITVEVYTHDINDITELDLEYANALDQIRQDVEYFRYSHGDES